MTNINKEIRNYLSRDISIQKNLKRKLINNRALARHLIKKYMLRYSIDAVLSAIRRYDMEGDSAEDFDKELETIFADMIILTKSNITSIKLTDKAFEQIAKDYIGKQVLKQNLRMVKGKENLAVMVNQKDLDKKITIFNKDDLLKIQKGLCEIRVVLPKDVTKIKGVLSRISSELSLHDVNLIDILICPPELFFYVEEKHLLAAQKCLLELKSREVVVN